MKITKSFPVFALLFCMVLSVHAQTYNTLWIPDTLSGTNFYLTAKDTFKQIVTGGNQTITAGYNGNWWGPTMIWQKGATVNLHITNKLQDSTTVHWHGIHLPAVMDGGPHQVIPQKTTWSPYFKVTNNAGTYWYHPHLHMEASKQLTSGLGGLIIVRDSIESKLALPRRYGVDDFPLVLTDRRFGTNDSMAVVPYGDSVMVNGTLRPQLTVPAQVVRFRILDAAIERSYNLGLSNGDSFRVISTDGGLVDTSVALTRFLISAGERVEILVNLTGKNGTSFDLKAYNSSLAQTDPGGDIIPAAFFKNALARINFNVLHIKVGPATTGAITTIPTVLTNNKYPLASSANLTRHISITDTTIPGNAGISFILNHKLFVYNYMNYTVPLNNTEIWSLESSSHFSHPFHIHDVEFYILSENGGSVPAWHRGWKDVIYVPAGVTIKFIAKFTDYADSLHPFMYHCHIALHEDEGMMGQFVVKNTGSGITDIASPKPVFNVYPNPAQNKIMVRCDDPSVEVYYITLTDLNGRAIYMLPKPRLADGIDISHLPAGVYNLMITDTKFKQTVNKTFIKN